MVVKNQYKDVFLFPMLDGGITKGYGVVDSNGKHLGVDIGWRSNATADVMSIQDGVVVATYWSDELGNVVVICHRYEDGTHRYTGYIHLSKILCDYGDEVSMGDVIGKRGDTGSMSNGPHLHIYVGKVTTMYINLSKNVRSQNWGTFLTMCNFDPLPYFYKSTQYNYNLNEQLYNSLPILENVIVSNKTLDETIKNIKNHLKEIETLLENIK